ncbi:Cacna1h [Symbiodinium natans]|uniref:Cacna1h protein n=1 Tax=Symbiodinium natans TaxID=878477 RepID=A0A812US94_9DINO|nr:Cacna1h [Symbiodinium natans]
MKTSGLGDDAPASSKNEELVQGVQGTPQAWAKNESEDGFSSDSDSSEESLNANCVNIPQPRKEVQYPGFRRNRSWQEPSSEVQRALNSLTSFRSMLIANQKKTLQQLDDELDRIQNMSNVSVAAAAAAAAIPVSGGRKSQGSTASEVKRFSFGALFPAVQKQRKRRMSWIPKTSPAAPESIPSLLDAAEVEKLTRNEKAKIKKDADEQQQKGMLVQLDPELARSAVRKRATDEFGEAVAGEVVELSGRCYEFATHPYFERFTMAIIFLNAMWISVDIEFNRAEILSEADVGFIIVENLFCLFFAFELIVRLWTYARKCSALRDIWFLFDVFLVALMSFETWFFPLAHAISATTGDTMTGGASVLRVARVLRVLRTARMARLVRLMPELMILIKGMMVACRSVFFTLVLLLMFTYVFSVAFVQFSRGTILETTFFGSMGTAIWTLLLKCILTDQQVIIEAVAEESWILAALILVFILFGSLTVMNMLLGVLVEAVKTVSTIEREQLEVDFAKKVLWEMIDKGHADEDGDNRISEQEYRKVLRTPEAMTALASLGVDVEAALDYGKLLFEDGEPLTFGDFMRGILTLRGSNQTTVKDIVELRKFTADEFSHIHDILSSLCKYVVAPGAPLHDKDNDHRPSHASLSSITSSGRASESC